jgi:hypothetical protein
LFQSRDTDHQSRFPKKQRKEELRQENSNTRNAKEKTRGPKPNRQNDLQLLPENQLHDLSLIPGIHQPSAADYGENVIRPIIKPR